MFKGNDQKIYFDGELLATLTQADATISLDYEDIEICGQYGTEHEYTGYSIEGTITRKKVDSAVLKKVHEGIVNGNMPSFVITGVNMNVNGKNESVTIQNAQITEIKLLNAEAKSISEEEIPFNASKFKVTSFI
jgi:hypothetical protein